MAKIELVKTDKFSFVLFEDVYNQEELDYIWQEVNFLCYPEKFLPEEETNTALDDYGNIMKSNKGIWLDVAYKNRKFSNYVNIHRKPLIQYKDVIESYVEQDYNLNAYLRIYKDCTLMSYYEDGDRYDKHIDASSYTYIFWLMKEPKRFTGGDLRFDDIDTTIPVKNNTAILFPSWAWHSVDEVKMDSGVERYKGFGRFAFTSFLYSA
jgi:hypothetical protein